MSGDAMPTEFRAKTWIHWAQALIFGFLAVFCLILGPLFLLEVLKDAKGASARDAGIALCAMSLPFSLIFASAVFNLKARRRPILRLCREGIEVIVLGSSSLDAIPLIPGLVRVAWLILSTQGFRRKLFCFPWECYEDAYVTGRPMVKRLTIVASGSSTDHESLPKDSYVTEQLVLVDAAFDTPLDEIADAIKWYANSSQIASNLPSWHTEYPSDG
jgi:hypothetical protein